MNKHAFDEAIALTPAGPDLFRGQTHPGYGNMVGPFGGVTAAQALQAVLLHPDLLGEPVSLTVNYAAALADGPFEVKAHAARTNRSTQHWQIEMVQDGAVTLTGTVLTAVRRTTWSVDDVHMPQVPPPHEMERVTRHGGVEWVKRYEVRPIKGSFPEVWDDSEGEAVSRLWMRDDPARALDFASLTAMADFFFPRIWLRRARRTPAGTVSMTVYFHAGAQQLRDTASRYLMGQAAAQAYRNGFFDQTAQIWNEAGLLLATTSQIVYYKE